MSIIQEALLKLNLRIENNHLEDIEDLYEYIELSSRMKALGDSRAFDKIPQILERDEFKGKLDSLLKLRFQRGMWDLDEQDGEELAFTLIEAQDYHLFYEFTKDSGIYSENTGNLFKQWAKETSLKMIDEQTASVLNDWLVTYPIPEYLRLPVVDSPVTEWDYELLGTIASFWRYRTIRGKWGPRRETRSKLSSHIRAHNRANNENSEAPNLRQQSPLFYSSEDLNIQVERALNSNSQLAFSIQKLDGSPFDPIQVRVGVFKAQQDPAQPKQWNLDLSAMNDKLRNCLLKAPMAIQLTSTETLEIEFVEK
ncbi:MAG: hypothetical protein K6C40_09530 [Thermoguttaceae bacterium]|nr:hypothetical protein [Thermoguttaceae bacterium]